jgi:hypothetical protein
MYLLSFIFSFFAASADGYAAESDCERNRNSDFLHCLVGRFLQCAGGLANNGNDPQPGFVPRNERGRKRL